MPSVQQKARYNLWKYLEPFTDHIWSLVKGSQYFEQL